MTKKKKPHALPDRKTAPKRTGKAGPRPIDPTEDFEKPTTAPGSPAEAAVAGSAPNEAATEEKTAGESKPAKVQEKGSSLLVEQPKKPKVVNGRFEAFYLKPVFGKTPKGDLTIGFRMTVPLEKEHEEVLPKQIWDGYKDVIKKNRAAVKFRDLPAQQVKFYLDDTKKEDVLELKASQMLQAHIDVVQRKGEGESRKVIRLSFVLQVKHSRSVASFADSNYGNAFWLKLNDIQDDLLELDEEE